jgi:hypothetical protein
MILEESLPSLEISRVSTGGNFRSRGKGNRDSLVPPEGSWELITDAGARTGVTEYTESNSSCPCSGVEEINRLPRWG